MKRELQAVLRQNMVIESGHDTQYARAARPLCASACSTRLLAVAPRF
jgi:hypothetical protein